jgi:o-succinylbenzoate synthase
MRLEYKPYTLDFKFDAGTSRGTMRKRKIWLLDLHEPGNPSNGRGEVAPLWRLSAETEEEVVEQLEKTQKLIAKSAVPDSLEDCYRLANDLSGGIASIRMGLEMAYIDWLHDGLGVWFPSDFTDRKKEIPINGLIWMNTAEHMKQQAEEKLEAGFKCLKMKIGAIDFDKELEVLSHIRKLDPSIEVRVDANGAFSTSEVLSKLNRLNEFDLHSIEQPILPGQLEAMSLIASRSPVAIALDEELIGVADKKELLEDIKPDYIVLKPSLLGGFQETAEWISLAKTQKIGWWITSALESNLGLSAITQFAALYDVKEYQGLGTGSLFHNNLEERTKVENGYIKYI